MRKLFWFALWALAMYGTLQFHRLEGLLGHAICGPWGCGPPLEALVGYHAFWFLLIVPPALLASSLVPSEQAIRIGSLLAIAGLGALLLVVVEDAVRYLRTARGLEYLFQRILFRLITFVDFPLAPIGLAGLAMRRLGMRRFGRERNLIQGSASSEDVL